ncbi:hypothetical protein AAY473_007334 [Plecturocebus cupreus]
MTEDIVIRTLREKAGAWMFISTFLVSIETEVRNLSFTCPLMMGKVMSVLKKKFLRSGAVAHACNPNTLGGQGRKSLSKVLYKRLECAKTGELKNLLEICHVREKKS